MATSKSGTVTVKFLNAFADAWNRHDVDALMAFMTDDCVFEASAGPDVCGTKYEGREHVRKGFAEVFATFPDAHGAGRGTSSTGIAASPSGPLRGHGQKLLAATCSPSRTGRLPSRTRTARTGRGDSSSCQVRRPARGRRPPSLS